MSMDPKKAAELREYYDSHELTDEDFARMRPAEPVPAEQVMITYSLRLPKQVMDSIREQAKSHGVKPTALMRKWIEERAEAGNGSEVVYMRLPEVSRVVHEAIRAELTDPELLRALKRLGSSAGKQTVGGGAAD